MSKVSGAQLLKQLSRPETFCPSFDVSGGVTDMILAALRAGENSGRGVFISSTPSSIKSYLGFKKFVQTIDILAADSNADYAIHLDHSNDLDSVWQALECGFTSVMFDGSHLPYDENVRLTQQVVAKAHAQGVAVEAELGVVGGKEDDLDVDKNLLPTVAEVVSFIQATNVDYMAPAVGTVHGFFSQELKLDWELAKAVGEQSTVPLVLHGGTGLSREELKRFVSLGFKKINFATTLRMTYQQALRDSIPANQVTKPPQYLNYSREQLVQHMHDLIF